MSRQLHAEEMQEPVLSEDWPLPEWSNVRACECHMLRQWADSNAHVFNNLLPSFDGDLLIIAKLES